MQADIHPESLINHTIYLFQKGWITKERASKIIRDVLNRYSDNPEIVAVVSSFLKSEGWDVVN